MLLQNDQLGYWNTLWVMLLDIYVVLTGPERRAVRMALWLAFFDQGCASTAIINYAPEVLERAGVTDYGDATLWSSAITAAKVRQGSIARWPWNALCPIHCIGACVDGDSEWSIQLLLSSQQGCVLSTSLYGDLLPCACSLQLT